MKLSCIAKAVIGSLSSLCNLINQEDDHSVTPRCILLAIDNYRAWLKVVQQLVSISCVFLGTSEIAKSNCETSSCFVINGCLALFSKSNRVSIRVSRRLTVQQCALSHERNAIKSLTGTSRPERGDSQSQKLTDGRAGGAHWAPPSCSVAVWGDEVGGC